jgi:hypothetical protein
MVAQAPLLASTISMVETEAMVDEEEVWTAHNLSALAASALRLPGSTSPSMVLKAWSSLFVKSE